MEPSATLGGHTAARNSPPSGKPPELAARRAKLAVYLILSVLFGLQVYGAWRTGVTIDEPSHLLSSYLYWHGADRLPPSDMPPAIKIVSGWAPALHGLPVPADLGHEGDTRHEWYTSAAITQKLPRETVQRLFFLSRLPLLIFPLLTGWLLWRWGQQLFSPITASILVGLYALEPTALAHGSLLKNDIAATLGYLFFWYRAWRFWRDPGWKTAAWIGVATFAACMAKLSMLILLLLGPLIILVRFLLLKTAHFRLLAASLFLAIAIPYAGSAVAYQFEMERVQRSYLEILARHPGIPKPFAISAHLFRVLPVPKNLWRGTVNLLFSNEAHTRVYMNGKVLSSGHPLYFALALAVKVPVALQVLVVAGFTLLALHLVRARLEAADLLWILPGFLYTFFASLSDLQLGIRLILPALPFGLLIAGAGIEWLLLGRRKYLLAALALFFFAESLRIYPHGIAFFNLWAGGPGNGLRYLADSNLDWGQGLPDLAHYIRANQIRQFRLAYFGADNPRNYFSADSLETLPPPYTDRWITGTQLVVKPGIYAISATLLPGHYFESRYRRYYSAFWNRRPIAKVAYSIYVYRIDND